MFRPDPEGMSSTYACPGPRGHAVHTTGCWDKVSTLRVLWGGPHTLSSGTKVKAAATCLSVSVTVLHLNVIYTLSDFRFRQVFSLIAFGGAEGRSVTVPMDALSGCFLHAPRLGIEPATLACRDDALTN